MDDAISHVVREVKDLRQRWRLRDARAAEVREVRHGNFDKVAPNLFSDEWPRPIVANRIKVVAQHAAAALAPLPQFSCQSVTATSDSARDFADKRTKIVNYGFERSEVQAQMQQGADQFYTYGLIVTSVEPDLEDEFPNIIIEESIGVYPVWDRMGRTKRVAHVFTRHAHELCAEYPELAEKITKSYHLGLTGDRLIEVVKYVSADRIVIYLADAPDCVLVDTRNPLGKCTYVCTQRPGLDQEIEGAFDDLIWVQLALHAMQTYTLSAAAEAVHAPIVVPNDVHDVAFGPGEIVRTNDPQGVHRLQLNVPSGAWAASEDLKRELEYGAITPEALGGSIDASVVTGKGVQQLMAGYSQQIAMSQQSLVGHFQKVARLYLEMDEKFWPNKRKAIEGHTENTPYKLSYVPAKDIKGDYSVEVQYGGIAGLDPNRGLVFLLQGLGAGLFSLDYVRRRLPSDMNPTEEENKIVVEQLRNSLIQGLSAYVQSIPAMAQQGQDPSDVIAKTAAAVKEAQKGGKVEDILAKLFPPPAPEPETDPGAAAAAEALGMGGGGGEVGPEGIAPGAPPTRGPGGRPDLQMMFAGLNSSGSPNLQAGVSRMQPTA